MKRVLLASLLACKSKAAPQPHQAPAAPVVADAPSDAPAVAAAPIGTDGELLPNADLTIGSKRFRAYGRAVFVGKDLLDVHKRIGKLDLATGKSDTVADPGFEITRHAVIGDRLVIAGIDKQTNQPALGVWSPTRVRRIAIDGGRIDTLRPSPDGKRVVIAGYRRAPVIVDIATETSKAIVGSWSDAILVDDHHWIGVRRMDEPGMLGARDEYILMNDDKQVRALSAELRALTISPSGLAHATYATRSDELVDLVKNRVIATLPSTRSTATWSPDGKELALAYDDGSVAIYTGDGTLVRKLDRTPRGERSVSFGPDMLALDSSLGVELVVGDKVTNDLGGGPRGAVEHLAFSGPKLVSGSRDHTVRVWELATGKLVASWVATPELASVAATAAQIATLTVDRSKLNARKTSTSSYSLDVRQLDGTGLEPIELPEFASEIGAKPDGTWVLAHGGETFRVAPEVAPVSLKKLALPDGSMRNEMLAGGTSVVVSSRNVKTDDGKAFPITNCKGNAYAASDLAAKSLAIGDADALRLYRRDGKFVAGVQVSQLAAKLGGWGVITPDDTVVMPTDGIGLILWNPATPTQLTSVLVGLVRSLAVSPDGASLAIGFANGQIGVYQVAKLRAAAYPTTNLQPATALAPCDDPPATNLFGVP